MRQVFSLIMIALMIGASALATTVTQASPGYWLLTAGFGGAEEAVALLEANGSYYVIGNTEAGGVPHIFVAVFGGSGEYLGGVLVSGIEARAEDAVSDGQNIYVVGTVKITSTNYDMLVMKLAPDARIVWARAVGGGLNESGKAVALGPNGEVVTIGWTETWGAGKKDVFKAVFDQDGTLQSAVTFGGKYDDIPTDAVLGPDGYIYIVGSTDSYNPWWGEVFVARAPVRGAPSSITVFGTEGWDIPYSAVTVGTRLVIVGTTDTGGDGKAFIASYDIGTQQLEWLTTLNFTGVSAAYGVVEAGATYLLGSITYIGKTSGFVAKVSLGADGASPEAVYTIDINGNISLVGGAVAAATLYTVGNAETPADPAGDIAFAYLPLSTSSPIKLYWMSGEDWGSVSIVPQLVPPTATVTNPRTNIVSSGTAAASVTNLGPVTQNLVPSIHEAVEASVTVTQTTTATVTETVTSTVTQTETETVTVTQSFTETVTQTQYVTTTATTTRTETITQEPSTTTFTVTETQYLTTTMTTTKTSLTTTTETKTVEVSSPDYTAAVAAGVIGALAAGGVVYFVMRRKIVPPPPPAPPE